MKKTNKGFTLVELIIVIAVIGVLAAILIPVFANVIEKANQKSALSDAKNALEIYIADMSTGNGAILITDGSIFEVVKNGSTWYFVYEANGLVEPDDVHTLPTGSAYAAATSGITKATVANLPSTVTIYKK